MQCGPECKPILRGTQEKTLRLAWRSISTLLHSPIRDYDPGVPQPVGDLIQPGEEECCSCGTDNVLLHRIEPDPLMDGKEHQHCEFCYASLVGNACKFPRPDQEILRTICQVANVLLKELRK